MNFENIQLPTDRKFGLFFSLIFFVIASYFFLKSNIQIFYIFLALTLLFLIISLIKAQILRPLNILWMRLGYYLGLIISPLVLAIIFFGIFMPIIIFFKLFGRDELGLKIKQNASHWKIRDKAEIESEDFKRQL